MVSDPGLQSVELLEKKAQLLQQINTLLLPTSPQLQASNHKCLQKLLQITDNQFPEIGKIASKDITKLPGLIDKNLNPVTDQ